jgi:glycosyltransferase involved in cell wall biosynthesis
MSQRLTISIAMCTYNGQKFLPEQLDSFLAQTRRPDELVVCDDGSTDRTVKILEKFKAKAPFPVRVFINEQNLGFRRNFEKALTLCREDLIAFSDQDDIWLPEKLQEVEQVFMKYPDAGYVFHDALVVDENLNFLGFSLWDYYGFSFQSTKHFPTGEFTKYCLNRVILGATITMKAKLRDYLLPLPDHWAHDTWVSFAGSLIMEVIALPKKLNKYRQYSHQLYGVSFYTLDRYKLAKKVGNINFIEQATKWKEGLTRLSSDERLIIDQNILNQISDLIEHLEIRGNINGSIVKRMPVILKEIATKRYHKYSNGWKSVAMDIFVR